PHVARDQDALDLVAPEQHLRALEQLRVLAERPGGTQARPPAVADPVAAGVPEQRAGGGAGHRVGARDLAQPDQHADREQQRQGRDDRTEDDDRVAERDRENGHAGGHGMGADPGDEAVEPGAHRRNYGSVSTRCAPYNGGMDRTGSVEERALKADSFGRVALMRDPAGRLFVRRDLRHVPGWLRLPAWWLARREARGLAAVAGMADVPARLGWNGRVLDRSFMAGRAMYQRPPRGDVAYFRRARRLLQALHRRGVTHNDLAKEANWLVLEDGRPAIVDFQLAVRGEPRSRWMRLLAREDLRHLVKHKRTYCPEAITPVERRLLTRPSWVRQAWFATGKPVYRFVTRRLLKWEDNEGQGPKP